MVNQRARWILEHVLSEGGHNGLYNKLGGCACRIGNLVPCAPSTPEENPVLACTPSVVRKCDCGGDCEFHVDGREGREGGLRADMQLVLEAVEKVDNEYGKLEGVTLEQWVAWFVSVNVAYHAFLNAKQAAEKEATDGNV